MNHAIAVSVFLKQHIMNIFQNRQHTMKHQSLSWLVLLSDIDRYALEDSVYCKTLHLLLLCYIIQHQTSICGIIIHLFFENLYMKMLKHSAI